jgi:hypothetical protein
MRIETYVYLQIKWFLRQRSNSEFILLNRSLRNYRIIHFIKLLKRLSIYYTGLSKKMDGIWNRYNLKSTGRIYTFSILKCSEMFKVLDLPEYILICAPFVALKTFKRNSISCHVFWIMSRVTVSLADVILSCRCWIFLIFSVYTMFLTYPPQKTIKWREV